MIAPVNLLLIAALAGVLSLCVLGSLARSGMAGIRETIRANLLTLLAFFTFALQNTSAPWWLSVVVPNAAIGLALFSYYSGVRRLLGLSVPKHLMMLACLLALVVLLVYTYVDWRVGPRIVVMSLLQMGFLLAVAVTVQRNMPTHRSRYSYRFVWAVSVISAALCALRAAVYLLDLALPLPLLEPSAWNIAFLTLGVLIMPCLTLGTIMIIHDRMLADREQEANTDFLTGLMSRKAWWMQAERYCAQALRTRRPLTLLLLDVDYFKRINDTHGHVAGDAVLRHFGLLATATLRTGDHVGRVGGEEFGVLFPDMRGDAVMDVAARLLDSVRRTPCAHGGSTISYTFSAGVAEWVPGENLQVFFERADRKLYRAKEAGRNRIVGPGEPAERLPAAA
ncbi:GGDEF domain-containing protein [Achromobacter spanius]|uniref:GGDEF domain-containing protein n=1 Tax=Achromobacter spanius TaxID=217203 RepID=UPI0036EDE2B4